MWDPAARGGEELLMKYVNSFPKAMHLKPKFCMLFVNYFNCNGQNPATVALPKGLEQLETNHGTAEDKAFVQAGFEKFLIKLLKTTSDQNPEEEESMTNRGNKSKQI